MLLIGDCGLTANPGNREVWDLATEWRRWTDRPFVFALWILRPGADATRIIPLLRTARERGQKLGAVDGTHGAVHYDLDSNDLDGLRHFWQQAKNVGLGRADADPDFATDSLEGSNG